MDYYEIIVRSYLKEQRLAKFSQLKVEHLAEGNTKLSGYLDQPALQAVFRYIRDLGVTLLAIYQREPEEDGLDGAFHSSVNRDFEKR